MDLEIQDGYGVKYMTCWYGAARGTAFCLVEPSTLPLRGTELARVKPVLALRVALSGIN
jgi:hypothetical protein